MIPADTLLDDVCCSDFKRVAAALQDAHGRSQELGPGIVTRLEAKLASSATERNDDTNIGFLLYLAAEFRTTEAHAPFVRILRLGADKAYDQLGDIITEDAPILLADTCPGSAKAIIGLVEDTSAGPFERNAGLQALAILWNRGLYPRDDLLALILKIAASLDPEGEDDALLGNGLIDTALAIQAVEIRDTILDLFDCGLTELNFVDREHIENNLRVGAAPDQEASKLEATINDAWEAVARWPFFAADRSVPRPKAPAIDHGRTIGAARIADEDGRSVPYAAPAKVGRNDPCPCGSGKKFKKCCGA